MQMRWHDLLFMHWPVSADALRPHVPPSLELDAYEGCAWIGVIPFRMTNVRPLMIPGLPASSFLEINVRTYVRHNDCSGVWFFSLDAASRLAVWGARRFFHLPYHFAEMQASQSGKGIRYRSCRLSDRALRFAAEYQPTGGPRHPRQGDLDHWLTERYCLFSADGSINAVGGNLYNGLKYAGRPDFVSSRIATTAARSSAESFVYLAARSFPESTAHNRA
jgi:uncharacterized protein YqjF (DUF2071 family)